MGLENTNELAEVWRRSVTRDHAVLINQVFLQHVLNDNAVALAIGHIMSDIRAQLPFTPGIEKTGGWILPAIIAASMDYALREITGEDRFNVC